MVINDVHVPDQCPLLWQTALRWILDNKPDEILILGDFGEYESMSQHGSAADTPTLRQDLEDNRQALEVLRRHAPNARFTYAEGNHETRPKRAGSAVLPRVASILDVPHMLGLNDLGIGWVKEGRMIRRGKLRFVHGYWASDNAAKTHLTKYGFSIACGHVHRPQVFTMPDGENNIRAAYVLPCMRTLDAAWLNGKPSGWTNGFSVHEYDDEGDFTLQMILAKDGKFIWNGRSYRP
ncbi:MAG: metallophosphoesterase [Aequoribacter sp.]|uniref:metallophosphoesterase n=1 Tax=Aequoribacter sp. TaxID=2847771 RepID=UPI003C623590